MYEMQSYKSGLAGHEPLHLVIHSVCFRLFDSFNSLELLLTFGMLGGGALVTKRYKPMFFRVHIIVTKCSPAHDNAFTNFKHCSYIIGYWHVCWPDSCTFHQAIGSDGNCRMLSPYRLCPLAEYSLRELRRLKIEQACWGMKYKAQLGLHTCNRRERYIKCPPFHFISHRWW